VLLAKRPSRMETVNDLDGEVMAFWRILRDRPAELERVCALTPHGRAEHAAAYEPVPADHPDQELETARRVWVRLTQARGGSMRRSGWRHYMDPKSSPSSTSVRVHGYVARMAAAAERLSRTSTEYRHEMPTEDEHRQLAEAFAGCNATVVLSGYETPLYADLYGGWYRREIETATGQGGSWSARTEVLWSNRPFPSQTDYLFEDVIA
jgi:DNA adenine methylase